MPTLGEGERPAERGPVVAVHNFARKLLDLSPEYTLGMVRHGQKKSQLTTASALALAFITEGVRTLEELEKLYGNTFQIHPGENALGAELENLTSKFSPDSMEDRNAAVANLRALRDGWGALGIGILYLTFEDFARNYEPYSDRAIFARILDLQIETINMPPAEDDLDNTLPIGNLYMRRGDNEEYVPGWKSLREFFTSHDETADFFGTKQWELIPTYLKAFVDGTRVEHLIRGEFARGFRKKLLQVRQLENTDAFEKTSRRLSVPRVRLPHLTMPGFLRRKPHTERKTSVRDQILADKGLSRILDEFE